MHLFQYSYLTSVDCAKLEHLMSANCPTDKVFKVGNHQIKQSANN